MSTTQERNWTYLADLADDLARARRLRMDGHVEEAHILKRDTEKALVAAGAEDLLIDWELEPSAAHPQELLEWAPIRHLEEKASQP